MRNDGTQAPPPLSAPPPRSRRRRRDNRRRRDVSRRGDGYDDGDGGIVFVARGPDREAVCPLGTAVPQRTRLQTGRGGVVGRGAAPICGQFQFPAGDDDDYRGDGDDCVEEGR